MQRELLKERSFVRVYYAISALFLEQIKLNQEAIPLYVVSNLSLEVKAKSKTRFHLQPNLEIIEFEFQFRRNFKHNEIIADDPFHS